VELRVERAGVANCFLNFVEVGVFWGAQDGGLFSAFGGQCRGVVGVGGEFFWGRRGAFFLEFWGLFGRGWWRFFVFFRWVFFCEGVGGGRRQRFFFLGWGGFGGGFVFCFGVWWGFAHCPLPKLTDAPPHGKSLLVEPHHFVPSP